MSKTCRMLCRPCGSLCAQEKDNGWPKVLDIYFENNDTVAFSWEEAITIEETGMYYLWFVICDDELSAATVRGQTTWKNPTGVLRSCLPPDQASVTVVNCHVRLWRKPNTWSIPQ